MERSSSESLRIIERYGERRPAVAERDQFRGQYARSIGAGNFAGAVGDAGSTNHSGPGQLQQLS